MSKLKANLNSNCITQCTCTCLPFNVLLVLFCIIITNNIIWTCESNCIMIKKRLALCEALETVQQTHWLFSNTITYTQDTTVKECPLPQLSSVQAGGSTAFIYANFSAPVVEVNTLRSTEMSFSCLQEFFCLKRHRFPITHFVLCSCQCAERSSPQCCGCVVEPQWRLEVLLGLINELQWKVYQTIPGV